MDGIVICFEDKHWLIQTEQGDMKLQDWQCETGMVPGKRVRLLHKKGNKSDGFWYATATEGDGTGGSTGTVEG